MEKPLQHKRIVVTRAPEQALELVRALESLGAEVRLMPTVSFAAAEQTAPLDAALRRVAEFDWLIFTSQNAVRYFCERAKAIAIDPTQFKRPSLNVAVVGPATSLAAAEGGFRVAYAARNPSGEALASELTRFVAGKSVLLPRSDRADVRLQQVLADGGANLEDVIAYRTLSAAEVNGETLAELRAGAVDAVLFASPSAFHNLTDSIPLPELALLSMRVNFAAIGPTTAKALREAGVRVAIQPAHASAILLADAVGKFYARGGETLAKEARTQ
jgi:uroporphyrinogen-III synthase